MKLQLTINLPDELLKAAVMEAVKEQLPATQPKTKEFPAYMNKTKAAAYAGISRGTLNSWIGQGLKVARLEGRYVVAKTDLDTWIEAHK